MDHHHRPLILATGERPGRSAGPSLCRRDSRRYPDRFSPPTAVVCDGVSRDVTATIVGTLYDGGQAKAIATLVAPRGTTTAKKTITIVAH